MSAELGFRTITGFPGWVEFGAKGDQREESGTGTEKSRRG